MIPVTGLKGELTAWKMHKRSAYGVLQTMGEYRSIVTVKAFASKEMTDDDFAASLSKIARGVYVTIDALLQSEPVTNNMGEKLKHPDSGREMYQHYLRIRDVVLISPAYHVQDNSHASQQAAPQAPQDHDERFNSEHPAAMQSQPAPQPKAASAPPPMLVIPAVSGHAAQVPWNTVGA